MRLTVLGCAGSFPGPDSAASGYLVQADDADGRTWTVLLDLGNGALGALQRFGDPRRLDAIGLSHLHADHVADLAVLNVLRRYHPSGPCPPVPVHGPAGTAERLAQLAGHDPATSTDGQFDVAEWRAGVPVAVGPLLLEPVRVEHPIPTFGIRVSGPSDADPGRTVTLAYTGDTDACDGLDTLADGVDLLLSEAGFLEGREDAVRGVHLTGRRAGEAAARGRVGRLVLTHIPAWTDPALPHAEAAGVYAGPIDLAHPGGVHVL
ncbi:MBL fold metallo-hydrolase [Cellulomonas fengjieae]|uniref:MBL fold metallo-hydrolase n=1 Tax=Cellulomonas fengjieae TaxID=2819978 RepID=A0ABS3SFT0_9CELL|nr:MBL fold metallo-hydrolase [Cellulomonas fengjieae]MBO3084592.1 MBL fold metallo-hydrolase [Cellulomonas fengjieae]MBO3103364.1 MBL fold metallo-hydrolase [Cellulomonas fengjieae]QVI67076.1 MBL fold metallo-hydrolase [Cellulomonas fengjieae]